MRLRQCGHNIEHKINLYFFNNNIKKYSEFNFLNKKSYIRTEIGRWKITDREVYEMKDIEIFKSIQGSLFTQQDWEISF